jgi:tetraacyldisaccharide 4'-kinase
MPWYRHLLWPFALVYAIVVSVRNRLFDSRLLPSKRFGVPLMCVGNLEMGGTGKSPLVGHIVRLLLEDGKRVAVVSRGYGRKTSGFRMVETDSSASDVGDEPLQLKRKYPNAVVAVCENRVEGIELLLKLQPKPEVVVMDDGFQHRWVKPSLSILTTPARLPFGKNHLFPVGTLREPASAAKRADVVVFTGSNEASKDKPNSAARSFRTGVVASNPIHFHGEPLVLNRADGVLCFSGIAKPERFIETVSAAYHVKGQVAFPDHHPYSKADVEDLRQKMDSFGADVKAIITTEKDAARLIDTPLLSGFANASVFYLPIELLFLDDTQHDFEKLILEHGTNA